MSASGSEGGERVESGEREGERDGEGEGENNELELLYVQIITRHGLRTPSRKLPSFGGPDYEWAEQCRYSQAGEEFAAPFTHRRLRLGFEEEEDGQKEQGEEEEDDDEETGGTSDRQLP
ncbi:MAG: hypothetical protein Q8P67_00385 [archaeon]|nr:hypothetical protein [archaeon]